MVSWNRCASWVTTPIAARSDSWVTDRTSWPPTRTDPERTSYTRGTSWLIVVLPAPEGPTSATSWPGAAVNETPCSTSWLGAWSSTATSSSEASDTSAAVGYENRTSSNSMEREPARSATASGPSAISGGRSSTSKTRSNETSALITSTRTLDSAVSGPYSRDSSSDSVTICQDSENITPAVSSRPITLETTPDSVEVNACWAPITSLLSRLTSAPVWVRVKNCSGIRCTWS